MGSLHAIALDATSTELPDHGKRCAPHRTSKECSLPRYLLIERPKMGHTKKRRVEPVPDQENQDSGLDTGIPVPDNNL
jgi:hypothetical protein